MAYDPEWIEDLFAGLGPIRLRRMFSGHGVYFGEFCIALAIAPGLCLRVDAQTRAAFEALGAAPFTYSKQHRLITVQAWWRLPDSILDDPDALTPWARLSLDAARRRPPGTPKKTQVRAPRQAKPKRISAS
ncbi:TfoX Regulator of competence-specific genes [Rhabdaerophilaceae bacterium]